MSRKEPESEEKRKRRINIGKIDARKLFIILSVIFIILSVTVIISVYSFFSYKIVRYRFSNGFFSDIDDINLESTTYIESIKIEYQSSDEDIIRTYLIEFDDKTDFNDTINSFSGKIIISKSIEKIEITVKLLNESETYEISGDAEIPYSSTSIVMESIDENEDLVTSTTEIPLWLEAISTLNPSDLPN